MFYIICVECLVISNNEACCEILFPKYYSFFLVLCEGKRVEN